jgi:hypothetical protein
VALEEVSDGAAPGRARPATCPPSPLPVEHAGSYASAPIATGRIDIAQIGPLVASTTIANDRLGGDLRSHHASVRDLFVIDDDSPVSNLEAAKRHLTCVLGRAEALRRSDL